MPQSKTSTTYDKVVYESYPFAQLHPARLAAVALLRGYSPPDVSTARVLELGCGAGGHLIPLAGFYPAMQLVGLDLAGSQIARGQARIAALGLQNVSLHACDLGNDRALDEVLEGQFDYIICQGVYYVVPDAVRASIWRLIERRLAPQGIAHVSFNAYPGWHLREVAQGFAQFHTQRPIGPSSVAGAQASSPYAAEKLAKDGLQALAQASAADAGYAENLKLETAMAQRSGPGLVQHEFLSGDNRPLYFAQMAQAAADAGLGYLGEASAADSYALARAPVATQQLALQWAAGDGLRYEQYVDYLLGRSYRQSLWVRQPPPWQPQLAGAVLARVLAQLHISAQWQHADPAPGSAVPRYTTDYGVAITPQANSLALCERLAGIGSGNWRKATDVTSTQNIPDLDTLVHLLSVGAVTAWYQPPTPTQHPYAPAWLRADALHGGVLTTHQHASVTLSLFERQVLALLDGSQSLASLVPAVQLLCSQMEQTLRFNGTAVSPVEQADALQTWLAQQWAKFGQCGWLNCRATAPDG